MELTQPPYQGHLKKLSNFIEPTPSRNIRIDPVALTAWGDKLEQGERDFPTLKSRLDALTYALDAEDWCPTRDVDCDIDHLRRVLSGYHCARYPTETRKALDAAESDLAIWRTLPQAARDERWDAREREEAEAAERRKAEAVLRARNEEFYATMKQLNVSPPRWLDNEIAKWSLA